MADAFDFDAVLADVTRKAPAAKAKPAHKPAEPAKSEPVRAPVTSEPAADYTAVGAAPVPSAVPLAWHGPETTAAPPTPMLGRVEPQGAMMRNEPPSRSPTEGPAGDAGYVEVGGTRADRDRAARDVNWLRAVPGRVAGAVAPLGARLLASADEVAAQRGAHPETQEEREERARRQFAPARPPVKHLPGFTAEQIAHADAPPAKAPVPAVASPNRPDAIIRDRAVMRATMIARPDVFGLTADEAKSVDEDDVAEALKRPDFRSIAGL